MQTNHLTVQTLLIVACFYPLAVVLGQGGDESKKTLQDQRKLLAGVHAGMKSEEVLKILGKPDEVRPVPTDSLLDGVRLLGGSSPEDSETERWVYGIQAKGKFARVGYVSIDRKGTVAAAVVADYFSAPSATRPEQVTSKSDQAAESPAKMSCHVGPIENVPAVGLTPEGIKTKITLKNSGPARFELKHDAAYSMRRFLLVEIYDSTGVLLYRDDSMRYHSPSNLDPTKWLALSVPAGKELSEDLTFLPGSGFGPFLPGKYSLRVYFPFEKGKYYPSNLATFELKEPQPKKPNGE